MAHIPLITAFGELTEAAANNANITLTIGAGFCQVNDFLVAFVAGKGPTATIGGAAGWTQLFHRNGANGTIAAFYKFYAGAGDDTGHVFTYTGGGNQQTVVGVLSQFRGVNTVNPVMTGSSVAADATNATSVPAYANMTLPNHYMWLSFGYKPNDNATAFSYNAYFETDSVLGTLGGVTSTLGSDASAILAYIIYNNERTGNVGAWPVFDSADPQDLLGQRIIIRPNWNWTLAAGGAAVGGTGTSEFHPFNTWNHASGGVAVGGTGTTQVSDFPRPYYVAEAHTSSGSELTSPITFPASLQVDDLMILSVCAMMVTASNFTTINTPAGWTPVTAGYTASGYFEGQMFWKRAVSGDLGGSVQVSWATPANVTASNSVVAVMRRVNWDANAGNPIHGTYNYAGFDVGSQPITIPSCTDTYWTAMVYFAYNATSQPSQDCTTSSMPWVYRPGFESSIQPTLYVKGFNTPKNLETQCNVSTPNNFSHVHLGVAIHGVVPNAYTYTGDGLNALAAGGAGTTSYSAPEGYVANGGGVTVEGTSEYLFDPMEVWTGSGGVAATALVPGGYSFNPVNSGIMLVGNVSHGITTTGNITRTMPSGTKPDDLIILTITTGANLGASYPEQAYLENQGFTFRAKSDGASYDDIALYYKRVLPGDPTSYTVHWINDASATIKHVRFTVYRYVDFNAHPFLGAITAADLSSQGGVGAGQGIPHRTFRNTNTQPNAVDICVSAHSISGFVTLTPSAETLAEGWDTIVVWEANALSLYYQQTSEGANTWRGRGTFTSDNTLETDDAYALCNLSLAPLRRITFKYLAEGGLRIGGVADNQPPGNNAAGSVGGSFSLGGGAACSGISGRAKPYVAAYSSVSTLDTGVAGSLSVTLPSDIQAGDIIVVALHGSNFTVDTNFTPPAGWYYDKYPDKSPDLNYPKTWLVSKIADGTEGGTVVSFAMATTFTRKGRAYVIRGLIYTVESGCPPFYSVNTVGGSSGTGTIFGAGPVFYVKDSMRSFFFHATQGVYTLTSTAANVNLNFTTMGSLIETPAKAVAIHPSSSFDSADVNGDLTEMASYVDSYGTWWGNMLWQFNRTGSGTTKNVWAGFNFLSPPHYVSYAYAAIGSVSALGGAATTIYTSGTPAAFPAINLETSASLAPVLTAGALLSVNLSTTGDLYAMLSKQWPLDASLDGAATLTPTLTTEIRLSANLQASAEVGPWTANDGIEGSLYVANPNFQFSLAVRTIEFDLLEGRKTFVKKSRRKVKYLKIQKGP